MRACKYSEISRVMVYAMNIQRSGVRRSRGTLCDNDLVMMACDHPEIF